jgi:hypothetical protein
MSATSYAKWSLGVKPLLAISAKPHVGTHAINMRRTDGVFPNQPRGSKGAELPQSLLGADLSPTRTPIKVYGYARLAFLKAR